MVDLDSQGNATTGVGVEKSKDMLTFYDVITGEADIIEVIQPTNIQNLSIIPSNVDLAGAEVDLVQIDMTRCWDLLGEITGDSYQDELLDQLFSQFCLGK